MSLQWDNMIPLFILTFINFVQANITIEEYGKNEQRIDVLAETIKFNHKTNGWMNIITFGNLPQSFYEKIKDLPTTFVTSNTEEEDYYFEEVVPYASSIIVIDCRGFKNFEESLRKVISLPNWHPHANIFIYYHNIEDNEIIAKIFFALWYSRAPNVLIFQYDDTKEIFYISYYNPYVSDDYYMAYKYGCWTVKNIGIPVYDFDEGLVCEEKCHNVTVKRKKTNLGTCIGFNIMEIAYADAESITKTNWFEDKGKYFHGYKLRGFVSNIAPFMIVEVTDDGKYTLKSRDGIIWNTFMKLMNFTIEITATPEDIRSKFNFEVSIQHIFGMAHRKEDLFMMPIYQFDVAVVELDYTFAFKDSGVCFMAPRAGFETILFDLNNLSENYDIFIEFTFISLGIWMIFTLYSAFERDCINADLVGKNFMNTLRTILLINLWNPPKTSAFRVFLAITVWSFFIINFSMQAAITSFFTAFKRGKEVETFDDIVERGYKVEGVASPDVVLPDTDERYRIINSRLHPITDLFGCIKEMNNDSRRFCLIDCSVGHYLERNQLNDKGEQYMHVTKDRVHSHYLNMVFPKHSVFADHVNKYMMIFFEAGLTKKWEDYRFSNIKEDAPVKALGMEDVKGILNLYLFCVGLTFAIFLVEFTLGNYKRAKLYCILKFESWKLMHLKRQMAKMERKAKKISFVNHSTQTTPYREIVIK